MHPHCLGHVTASFPGWPQKLPELSCVAEGRRGQTPAAGSTHLELRPRPKEQGEFPWRCVRRLTLQPWALLSIWTGAGSPGGGAVG